MPMGTPFWHMNMPYVFQRIENPVVKNLYLPLNRDYKPLGFGPDDFVIYEHHLRLAMVFSKKLEIDFLYDDGTCRDFPRYANELHKIMQRKHWVLVKSASKNPMIHPKADEIVKWGLAKQ